MELDKNNKAIAFENECIKIKRAPGSLLHCLWPQAIEDFEGTTGTLSP